MASQGWLSHDSSSPAEMILFINVPARSDFRAHVKHMCSCVAGRGHLVNDFFLSPLGAWGELIHFTEASDLFLEVHHEPCQVSKALENSPSLPRDLPLLSTLNRILQSSLAGCLLLLSTHETRLGSEACTRHLGDKEDRCVHPLKTHS